MTSRATSSGGASAPPHRVLVNLSGGVDSAYCLWRALEAGQDVLVHHIELRNHEGRLRQEKAAVHRILQWCRSQHFPGSITFLHSGFDYGDLAYVVRDLYIWGLLTGVILSNPDHADRAVVVSSYHLSNPNDPEEVRRREVVRAVAGFEPDWITPLAGMTKAEVVGEMPSALVRLCWWCRRPRGQQKCGKCRTCRQMASL